MQPTTRLLSLTLFLVACRAPAPAVAVTPLQHHAQAETDYVAELDDVNPRLDRDGGSSPSPRFHIHDDHAKRAAAEVEAGPLVDMACRLVSMPIEDARTFLGRVPGGGTAWIVDLAEARALFESDSFRERSSHVNSARLTFHAGEEGEVRLIREIAYVSSYELEWTGESALADPVIEVAQEGVLLRARAEIPQDSGENGAPPAVALELNLALSEIAEPFPQSRVELPGSFSPVTIQQPVAATQRLDARATLRESDALLLFALSPDRPGELVLVLVAAHAPSTES